MTRARQVEELNRQSGKLDTTTAHTDQLLSKLERTDTSLVDCKKDVDRLNSLCNLQVRLMPRRPCAHKMVVSSSI